MVPPRVFEGGWTAADQKLPMPRRSRLPGTCSAWLVSSSPHWDALRAYIVSTIVVGMQYKKRKTATPVPQSSLEFVDRLAEVMEVGVATHWIPDVTCVHLNTHRDHLA
jgi:hypothetical protein